jgi:4-oxalocrotonate tautomerase
VLLKTFHIPVVKIEVTREGVTKAQKAALIRGVTDLLSDVLNKDPQFTYVAIQEYDLDDWGHAGEQVWELRKRGITAERKKNHDPRIDRQPAVFPLE